MKTYSITREGQDNGLTRTCGKIQEEELCRILDLRKNLQFCDMLIKHLSHYLSLGWHLAAFNSQSRVHHPINFQEPQETWSEKLIEIGLDGVEINVGVRTGSASGLLILEVPKHGRGLPFRREDWSSECVAEAGPHLEQHYYELPEGWRLPPAFVLDPFEVKVFGEGDLVLAPPSVEPRTRDNWRWVKPPWDKALSTPPPILRKIIKGAVPAPDLNLAAPAILAWEEIYPLIAPHPGVLQALMSPAPTPENYYQQLLAAARAGGLHDPEVLLGLLWHAPWGDARERLQGRHYLQQLLHGAGLAGVNRAPAAGAEPQASKGEPRRLADCRPATPPAEQESGRGVAAGQAPAQQKTSGPGQGNGAGSDHWQEWFRASQESLIIERHRYEAMIYELGKLHVWQEIGQQERRENRRLSRKLEAHLAREVDYLRNLLKKNS